MAMNREQRRYLQKQGQLDKEGNPVSRGRDAGNRPPANTDRVGPAQYVGEVRSELRRVNWPTRREVINYTIIVLITLIFMTALIGGLDLAFGEGVLRLLRVAK